jgi:hypothetical protein
MIGSLRDTVRMEAVRLSTLRSTYLLVGFAVLVGGLIAVLVALVAPARPLSQAATAAALTAGGDSVPLTTIGWLLAALGMITVGHDYRYGLWRAVLTAQPLRTMVVVARLLVLAVTGSLVATLTSALGAGLCWLVGRAPTLDRVTLRVAAAHVVITVLWAWLGAGLTWVLRSTAAVVSVLLVVPLMLEPGVTLLSLAAESADLTAVARWLPFSAARQALLLRWAPDGANLGALVGGLTFALTTAVVVVLGWLLLRRRDA